MSVRILVVDDEPDVAELFCQHFRREARQGTYVMHFAASAEKACPGAADRRDRAQRGGDPLGHQHAEHGRPAIAVWDEAPGNQSYRFERGDKADVDAAFAAAAHIVEIELINNRLIVAPTSRARRSAITMPPPIASICC